MTDSVATEAGIDRAGIGTALQLDAFRLSLRPITAADNVRLHHMTVGVNWPHRLEDLDLIIASGKGVIGVDAIDRAVCTAMWFPMGRDFATVGMMTTTPRLQAQGAGRWLLQTVMQQCEERDLRLNATRAGYSMYLEAGFIPVCGIRQMQGRLLAVPALPEVPGLDLRPVGPGDLPQLERLDAAAFGAERGQALALLMAASVGHVAMLCGRPAGFALRRSFGKGQLIGPLVAEDPAVAMHLVSALMRGAEGQFLRLDVPEDREALIGFLSGAGLRLFDSVTEMRIGPHRRSSAGPVTFALAAHSLG